MKALRLAVAALLFSTSAQAQFSGASIVNGGTANAPIPDLSMCLTPPTTLAHVWSIDPVNGHTAAFWAANPPSSGIVGDATNPWDSLKAVFASQTGYTVPLLTTAGAGGGPIAPGDEILLNTGTAAQYGAITIPAITNSSFVTIAAASGQTPVLSSMTMVDDSKFVFSNISIQSVGSGGSHPVLLFAKDSAPSGVATGLMHDVIFDHMSVSSASNATTATWLQSDWANLISQGVRLGDSSAANAGRCLTLSNSLIFNTANSVALFTDNANFTNNEIADFADDAVDYAGNNQKITNNYIHDYINIGDGVHVDGMQGFITRPFYHDILIDSNTLIWQTGVIPFETSTDAAMSVSAAALAVGGSGYAVNDSIALGNSVTVKVTSVGGGGAVTAVSATNGGKVTNGAAEPSNPVAQVSTSGVGTGATINLTWVVFLLVDGGITGQDSGFVRETVTNNVVVFPQNTLNIVGCRDCLVAGNTVLPAFFLGSRSGGTLGEVIAAHTSPPFLGSNITIRNNLVGAIGALDTAAHFDHNIIVNGASGGSSTMDGVHFFQNTTAGNYCQNGSLGCSSDANLVDTAASGCTNANTAASVSACVQGEITQFNSGGPSVFTNDFHLVTGAAARGAGTNTTPTPLVDITGITRSPAFDVGAYAFH